MFNMPVHANRLHATSHEARATPRADIRLAWCPSCGHIRNVGFDAGRMRYDGRYENALHFSPRFQDYAASLAADLVTRHGLRGGDVLEIGCGDGEFLLSLCDLGGNSGLGIDPGVESRVVTTRHGHRVTFVRDVYSDRYATHPANLVCCRHLLEHMENPAEFLGLLRHAGGSTRPIIYLEVPDTAYMLEHAGVWDILYEHCSYFSAPALTRLAGRCGFDVHTLWRAYGGQYLCLELRRGNGQAAPPAGEAPLSERTVEDFSEACARKIDAWRHTLTEMARDGRRAVVWGAGSKGVTFLNAMGPDSGIEYAVDLNPRKHGMYVAGTGQCIVAPEALRRVRPEVVIVMNPVYEEEIRRHTAGLGVVPSFLPADRWTGLA
jgi:hypothetical protein